METLRGIIVVLHLVAFALLFGGWLVEAFAKRVAVTRLMQWGMAAAFVTGVALSAPWGLDGDPNYVKITIKLVVLVAIGALLGIGSARQRRSQQVPAAMFWLVGLLTLANATIAVLV